MPRFRQRTCPSEKRDFSLDQLRDLIAEVLQPGHFFVGRGFDLAWDCLAREEVPWEIFRGRLLDPAHTRQRQAFASWNIYQLDNGRAAEPILSLKLDAEARQLHVTRALLCHVWEGYDAGKQTILSRETTRWVRELVGTIALDQFQSAADLRDEIAGRVFQAVVGTSRLPLTSVEAPLPAFSLGQLAFFDLLAPPSSSMTSFRDLIKAGLRADLSWLEAAKLVETVLRAVRAEEIAGAASLFVQHWQQRRGRRLGDLPALLRTLFNNVSLSPYTAFVDNALAFLQNLVDQGHLGVAAQADFLSYLLRQLGRHLTAYDLVTFHHQGANYPDALLLDAVLKVYLNVLESRPDLFLASQGQCRRRALRQGCLLRRHYEGHLVPDAPTSPGENARVLPPPHIRVPEEQLLQPAKRTRRLYEGDPLTRLLGRNALKIFQESLLDLYHPAELRELGMAVFIDRPLGAGKAPAEPDQTPLFAHEAFSRSIAGRRLLDLGRLARDAGLTFDLHLFENDLRSMSVQGLSIQEVPDPDRPVASIADARRVAEDFVLLRTLPAGVNQFLDLFDLGPPAQNLDFLSQRKKMLIVSGNPRGVLVIYDDSLNKRLELEVDTSRDFTCRGGVEFPTAGLGVRSLCR